MSIDITSFSAEQIDAMLGRNKGTIIAKAHRDTKPHWIAVIEGMSLEDLEHLGERAAAEGLGIIEFCSTWRFT